MRAFVVDAFTDSAFGGNPAGVVLVDAPVGAVWMQSVAAELRHSETAFVGRRADGTFDLRWFTPAVEVDLCGHATLATAHVLASLGEPSPLTFHTRSGTLGATVEDGARDARLPGAAAAPDRRAARPRTGARHRARPGVDATTSTCCCSRGRSREVRSLQPDLGVVARLPYRGLVVTAQAADTRRPRLRVALLRPAGRRARGSGHRLGALHARPVLVRSGWAAPRSSACQLSDRRGRVEVDVRGSRVALRGTAVTVLAGDLLC